MVSNGWRLRAFVGLAVLLGAATAVSAVLGWDRAALVGLTFIGLMGIAAAVLVARHQRTQLQAVHRRLARQQKRLAGQLEELSKLEQRRAASVVREAELEAALTTAQAELARLDDLENASFRLSIRQYVREVRAEHALRAWPPSAALQLPRKLRNLELAASHGVGVPEVYRVWPDLDSLDLSELPDEFVVKSDGGAGSVAVFPLARAAQGRYRLVGAPGEYTAAELVARFRELGNRARAPFFAEELLHGVDGGPIPDDVKFYMFYGRVGQILVRTVATHGRASTIRLKFIDEEARDFGEVAIGRPHDPSIAIPASLTEMTAAAKHLSRAVGLPFCRVDLYETSSGVMLGEITRAPSGGNEYFTTAQDQLLGRHWIDASARLTADLGAGRPMGPLFGERADLHLYSPSGRPRDPATFPRTVRPCSQWCTP